MTVILLQYTSDMTVILLQFTLFGEHMGAKLGVKKGGKRHNLSINHFINVIFWT